jgi:hypothetical protein
VPGIQPADVQELIEREMGTFEFDEFPTQIKFKAAALG